MNLSRLGRLALSLLLAVILALGTGCSTSQSILSPEEGQNTPNSTSSVPSDQGPDYLKISLVAAGTIIVAGAAYYLVRATSAATQVAGWQDRMYEPIR